MKYTLGMGKKGFTILIITVIYLCAAGATLLPLFGGNSISDARVKNRKANNVVIYFFYLYRKIRAFSALF